MHGLTKQSRRGRAGFTLIEAAVATAIIGFAVVAVIELLANGNRASGECIRAMTAMHVAQDMREYTMPLSTAQLDALNGDTFDPPIDARGQPIASLAGWRQTVSVTGADINRLTLSVPLASNALRRISVLVTRNGETEFTARWLSADTSD